MDQVIVVEAPLSLEASYTVGNLSLEIDLGDCIGRGGSSVIFKGKFEGQEVAVKQTQLPGIAVTAVAQEIDILRRIQHQNVVGFLHCEEDANFRQVKNIYFTIQTSPANSILIYSTNNRIDITRPTSAV